MTKKRRQSRKKNQHQKKKQTRRAKRGGDPNEEVREDIQRKNLFRRTFVNFILQLKNARSNNETKSAMSSLTKLLTKNPMINTLIPITADGRPVDKETYSLATKPAAIDDMVSPLTVVFDNLSDKLSEKDMQRLLMTYYTHSGNFNAFSSRFKRTPFMHEVQKQRIQNVKRLLDKSQPYHIMEEGLDSATKDALSILLPNEQQIVSVPLPPEPLPKLSLPYPLPTERDKEGHLIGYDTSVAPEFWKPLFRDGAELFEIRNTFWEMYKTDRYMNNNAKRFQICQLLETIIPGYRTRYMLSGPESVKTLVNTGVLNCFIMLLFGIVLYKLYDTQQDYVFMFKGGRAVQLSLVDIPKIESYHSDDADVLIIPNEQVQATYQESLMTNLSAHLGLLIKWMIPDDLNIVVSLPVDQPKINSDITKVLYKDDKLYVALSDIGFGKIRPEVRPFFDHLVYSPFYIDQFETNTLFITPTLDDILDEKLYYYVKYMNLKKLLNRGEPIMDQDYVTVTSGEVDFYLYKFKRAIIKLVEAVLKRDFPEVTDLSKQESSKLILKDLLKEYHDASNEEKETIVSSIFI